MMLSDFAPALAALGIYLGITPVITRTSPVARLVVVVFAAAVLARYMAWRFPETVVPADPLTVEGAWIWFLFAIETLALFDAAILWLTLVRRRDRRPEADAHAARLCATDPADLPAVDVFIPTYDEGRDVLERTIVGTTWLDWPADRLRVHVLDDSDRDWLQDLCAEKDVDYLRRDGNADAKSGNINAALTRTSAPFVAIFDADFIPHRQFLMRTVGFFQDPRIGIVQAPHEFFNHDPMQSNLALRRTLPDDQRLFFDEIMPGKDGWDCAFCCGSNSITRREAFDAIGGGLPTGSITEDILLTLTLLRRGYVTRFLGERLAIGLAPESLGAMFVQRSRWARGAMQILHLRDGPLGPGLTPIQRLMFLPLHWLTQAFVQTTGLIVPIVFLWFDVSPLHDVQTAAIVSYQVPMIITMIGTLRFFATGAFFPLAQTAIGVMQSFRLLPGVLATLVKPWNLPFSVTPKGNAARAGGVHRPTLRTALVFLLATAGGLLVNAAPETRIVARDTLIPVVAFWCVFNATVLLVVIASSVAAPARRAEERFELDEPATIGYSNEELLPCRLDDVSLSGARVRLDGSVFQRGDRITVVINGVGLVPATVMRAGEADVGVRFDFPEGSPARDALIRRLFTEGLDNSTHNDDALGVALGMIRRALGADSA